MRDKCIQALFGCYACSFLIGDGLHRETALASRARCFSQLMSGCCGRALPVDLLGRFWAFWLWRRPLMSCTSPLGSRISTQIEGFQKPVFPCSPSSGFLLVSGAKHCDFWDSQSCKMRMARGGYDRGIFPCEGFCRLV